MIAGTAGLLGVATNTVTAEGAGYRLEVRYARVARGGLEAPWEVRVTHDGGFPDPVTIVTTASYFDLFDENGLDPDPASVISAGDDVIMEFDPPEGGALVVSFDARIGPSVQRGSEATTQSRVGDQVVAAVTYQTWILP